MNEIKTIDLFGGIGGFRCGLERANQVVANPELRIKHSKRTDKSLIKGARQLTSSYHNFKCVWYCDKDKYSVQTYNKNFQEDYEPTDIATVNPDSIPDFDMLCAGFPCQSFSIAGKRKGFKDIRGTMFFEICRIAQAKRPRLLFLENVKGLLSHDGGQTFATILTSLSELGYVLEWQVLNSKNYGVPQNRERVFIIGHLRGTGGQEVFPIGEGNRVPESENRSKQKGGERIQSQVSPTIDGRYGALRNAGEPYIISNPHGFNNGGFREMPNIRLSGKDNEFISQAIESNNYIRRLTPVECERLQGFPDNWTEGVSDTQRYKQLGNAVTVNVIEAIGEKILCLTAIHQTGMTVVSKIEKKYNGGDGELALLK